MALLNKLNAQAIGDYRTGGYAITDTVVYILGFNFNVGSLSGDWFGLRVRPTDLGG